MRPWWLRRWSVCLQCGRPGFNPWVGKISWRRNWQPTPVLLPGKSHGHRSLVGYRPWGCKESDTTEWLHFPLNERTRKPRKCLDALLCCSGAPCHSDTLTSSHQSFLCACGRGGREAVRGLLPPQVPLRNQCTSPPLLRPPPYLGNLTFLEGVADFILRSSQHYFL